MNNPHRMDDLLSRHRLGELPPHLEKEVLEFLSTREGRRRLEELEAEDERILLESPPRRVADEIRRRLDVELVQNILRGGIGGLRFSFLRFRLSDFRGRVAVLLFLLEEIKVCADAG